MNKIRFKKEYIIPAKWQVWWAYIGFYGCNGGKKRPVLITKVLGESCHIAEISSRPPAFESDIPILDYNWAGLNRESVIQIRKTKVVRKDLLSRYMGELSDSDRRRIKGVIS